MTGAMILGGIAAALFILAIMWAAYEFRVAPLGEEDENGFGPVFRDDA